MKRRRRDPESGFAMLLVFAMAAAVAIMLYKEMPRVVFESRRTKEDMLIERGEQYRRAIQLYVRKFKRYPSSLDDLEKTNNIRFLRRRYRDPLTGKDEWREIHIDGAGMLTDSKVQKNPLEKDKKTESAGTFVPETTFIGGSDTNPALLAQAIARRASDRPAIDANNLAGSAVGMDPNAPQTLGNPEVPYLPQGQPPPPEQPYNPGQPGQPQPSPYLPPYAGGTLVPGQSPLPLTNPTQPGQPQPFPFPRPGQVISQGSLPFQPQQYPFQPQQQQPGPDALSRMSQFGGFVGQQPAPAISSQFGGMSPFQTVPGANRPGAALQGNNAALDLIRRVLTTPRPEGFPGAQAAAAPAGIGGGLAGVASKMEADAIKVYNERTKYQEWEFIYELKNDRTALGGVAGVGIPLGPAGQRPGQGQQPGPGSTPQPSPFGGQPSPFGGQPFPGGAPPPPPPAPGGRIR